MEEKKTGNATGAEETGKLFTQEDVNRIISERLGKEREKAKKEQDAAFAEREKAVSAREMHMTALEQLSSQGLPVELAEAINCSDEESIHKSIEILVKNYTGSTAAGKPLYSPQSGGTGIQKPDLIREAMGLSKGNHPKPTEGYAFGWNSKTGESAYIDANNKNKPI